MLYLDRGKNSHGTVYFYSSASVGVTEIATCLGSKPSGCRPPSRITMGRLAPQPTVDTINKAHNFDPRSRRQIGQGLRRKVKVERARFVE
jgi:hypothetical protein